MLAAQGPVGTRGGVEWMRGPGACPGWGATWLLHAVPNRSRCHQDKHQAPTLPHICMSYSPRDRSCFRTSYPLSRRGSAMAKASCLAGTQALFVVCLLHHQLDKLLKTQRRSIEPFERN